MKIITIIIPIYNRLEVTKEGISSIIDSLNHYYTNGESSCFFNVVIVDDGSTDGSSNWIAVNHPKIHLLQGDGNLWWSGAVNMGAKYSIEKLKSDFLLLMNDDVELKEDYFVSLERLLSKEANSIIGSTIIDIHTQKTWSKLMSFNTYTGISTTIDNFSNKPNKWVTGMGVVVPAAIINKIGYWDSKNFPQYFGDADYAIRASIAGYRVICNKNLVIYNRTEYSSYTGKDLNSFIKSLNRKSIGSRYNLAIRLKFYKKHCITPLWAITYLLYYIKYTIRTFIIKK